MLLAWGRTARWLGALSPLSPPRVEDYGSPLRGCAGSPLHDRPSAGHRRPWSSKSGFRSPSSDPIAGERGPRTCMRTSWRRTLARSIHEGARPAHDRRCNDRRMSARCSHSQGDRERRVQGARPRAMPQSIAEAEQRRNRRSWSAWHASGPASGSCSPPTACEVSGDRARRQRDRALRRLLARGARPPRPVLNESRTP